MTTPDRFYIVEAPDDQPGELWIEGEVLPAYIGPEEAEGILRYGKTTPLEVARNSTACSPRGELLTLAELLDTAGGERALAEWRAGDRTRRDAACHDRYTSGDPDLRIIRGEG
jgi:hypothetical protein